MGTPITWLGIISLPLSIYFGVSKIHSPKQPFITNLSRILKGIIILAILWVPICFLLSGNFSNSFSEKEVFQGGQLAMKWFWRFTYGIVISPLLIICIHWTYSIYSRMKK